MTALLATLAHGMVSGLFGAWAAPVTVTALVGWAVAAAAMTGGDPDRDATPETWDNGLTF